MKKNILLISIISLFACSKEEVTENLNQKIQGKWTVNNVDGDAVIYPNGTNSQGTALNFNLIWKGATFEFLGTSFMEIQFPESAGGFSTIYWTELNGNKLKCKEEDVPGSDFYYLTLALQNSSTLKMTAKAEDYKKLMSNQNVEIEVNSDIVFTLKK